MGGGTVFDEVGAIAAELGLDLPAEEVAALSEREGYGSEQLAAVAGVMGLMAKRKRDNDIATMLRLSRLPQREPKTFGNFDFARIQGRDAAALRKLPDLANLYARKNLAFIGPSGIGKTHLAQAYGRECCLRVMKSYYIKATELRDKLRKACLSEGRSRAVSDLVKPSCLIVDEIGRCVFDKGCTDLFFDVVDRRYEKDAPNVMILTSNMPANTWHEYFTGDDTMLCALDRIFDKATVFMMAGPSYRGAGLETLSVEAVPQAVKLKK